MPSVHLLLQRLPNGQGLQIISEEGMIVAVGKDEIIQTLIGMMAARHHRYLALTNMADLFGHAMIIAHADHRHLNGATYVAGTTLLEDAIPMAVTEVVTDRVRHLARETMGATENEV